MKIVTIGGYGFTEQNFVKTLKRAQVDTFVDVRQRRGLRGRLYSFLNSTRLQALLAEAGIRYVYLPELAPTSAIRAMQAVEDDEAGVGKRDRKELAQSFVRRYEIEILGHFNSQKFLETVGRESTVALFCVERSPGACHRSLAAKHIAADLGIEVEHLT